MPVYTIDIQKRIGSEFWTNRYIGTYAAMVNAVAAAQSIVASERTIHSTLVSFVNFRVSNAGISEEYTIVPVNLAGQRGETNLLPLFNTLRYDLAAEVGRPSRKFYRGVLGEVDISGDAITVNSAFTDHGLFLLASSVEPETPVGLHDPQGDMFVDVTVHPFVQMRQLRRGKRKRQNPVFQ